MHARSAKCISYTPNATLDPSNAGQRTPQKLLKTWKQLYFTINNGTHCYIVIMWHVVFHAHYLTSYFVQRPSLLSPTPSLNFKPQLIHSRHLMALRLKNASRYFRPCAFSYSWDAYLDIKPPHSGACALQLLEQQKLVIHRRCTISSGL